MPRKRNPLAVAAGKLILAIQGEPDAAGTREVMSRAHTLQHAAHNKCVATLLDGRSIAEYLDAMWVATHPAVKPSVDAFALELSGEQQ